MMVMIMMIIAVDILSPAYKYNLKRIILHLGLQRRQTIIETIILWLTVTNNLINTNIN